MKSYLSSLKSAVASLAEKHPRLLAAVLVFVVVQPLSQCAHKVDPKAGKVFDAVAPVVVTEIVDAVAEPAATSSTSTGAVEVEPVTVIGTGGAGGK